MYLQLDPSINSPIVKYLLDGLRLELKRTHPLEEGYPNAWCHLLDLILNNVNLKTNVSYLSFCYEHFIAEVTSSLSKKQQVALWKLYCSQEIVERDYEMSELDYFAISFSTLPSNFLTTIADGLWSAFLYWDSYDLDTEMENAVHYYSYKQISYRDQLDTIPTFAY